MNTTIPSPITNIAKHQPVDESINKVSGKILDSAFKIHKMFGPGLLESAYEQAMAFDLVKNHGLKVEMQKTLPIMFEECKIDAGYRIDMLVDDSVIVELKAVEKLAPLHEAQLMTYLRLSGIRLGLLLNFNTKMMKDGIKRIVV